jgi:uncharacterized membrane protein
MFLGGTVGIILGGPIAVLLVSLFNPAIVGGAGPDAVWRGLSTIAGSWIGGSANQTAMKEVFGVSDNLFSALIAVDVLVANLWTACLLFAAARSERIDAWLGADTTAITAVKQKVEEFRARTARIPALADVIVVLAVGFWRDRVRAFHRGHRGAVYPNARAAAGAIQPHEQVLLDRRGRDDGRLAPFASTESARP